MLFKKSVFTGIDFRPRKLYQAIVKMERDKPIVMEVRQTLSDKPFFENSRIKEKQELSLLLEDLQKGKGDAKKGHFVIPTEHTLIRKIRSLPDIKENELAKILKFQLGESIVLPFENPIYDFVKIGSFEESNRTDQIKEDLLFAEAAESVDRKSEILFFATSKELSTDLMEVCEGAGIKPLTAEMRGLALQRLVYQTHPNWVAETHMIVDVSNDSIEIHIFNDEIIIFSRSIELADVHELSDEQHSDEVLWLVDEARDEVAVTKTEGDNMVPSSQQLITDITNEITKAQNFFRYSLGGREQLFERIVLTGELADQVKEGLAQAVETEVSQIDFQAILSPDFKTEASLDAFSVAIGLACRGNEKVNKKWKNKK
ncbi:pilus assembly protein PilM [Alkalihalobacillus sp. MEB130]|uniref:type IV pilus biogenesis protein PilM n=1 Tax=Alkalihalobacillus sp. MEB130 TaxID=2976704 RepID=UPI0028DD8CFD|nr:pilus assembly protein PilM [Alkalihalobacillus sp. MEB130]MDT8859513.1 pilus assembly protein PilM [Alkalihalobacillus sp. MEB130]